MEEMITALRAVQDIDDIYRELFWVDIPSPTVPAYIEHHESIQKVMNYVRDRKKEIGAIPKRKLVDALYDIQYVLEDIDIPFPTTPEYEEHHIAVQAIIGYVKEKLNNLEDPDHA